MLVGIHFVQSFLGKPIYALSELEYDCKKENKLANMRSIVFNSHITNKVLWHNSDMHL